MSRLERKKLGNERLKLLSKCGLLDCFDNEIKHLYYIDDAEYDYISENLSTREIDIIISGEIGSKYSITKEALTIIDNAILKMNTRMSKLEDLIEMFPDEEFLKANGLDDAIIGYDANQSRLVYSIEKSIEVMMRDNDMTYMDAMEYLEYNTFNAYVGEKTPLWVNTCD